jgi:hypothetical protein
MNGTVKQLTPMQEATARAQGFKAFEKEFSAHNPVPTPEVKDLFQDNPTVARRLTTWVSYIPLLLVVIMAASVVISSDKTMRAMHDSVAGTNWLFGFWSVLVTACAMLMLEGGLIVAEFAQVRDRISKQLPRQVWNLRAFVRAVKVRIGSEQPLDYSEMPDPTLSFYSRFMFAMVLIANAYGVLYAYTDGFVDALTLNTPDKLLEFTIFFIVGIGGALSLRLTGSQLAHMSHELYAQRRQAAQAELHTEWRAMLEQEFAERGEQYINAALHRKFLMVNALDHDAESPYMLLPGEEDDGIELVPFAPTSSQLYAPASTRNGNGTH